MATSAEATSSWNQKRPKKPLKYGNDFLNPHFLPPPNQRAPVIKGD